jgi:beta-mannosidase
MIMQRQSLNGTWQLSQAGKNDWLPGPVPGDVHTALMAANRIPDPYVRDNEKRVMWVAETAWEYRMVFSIAPSLLKEDKVLLVCDGLDTLAHVTLNGQHIGDGANMFRTYIWDVKGLLKEGENTLHILFDGPMAFVTPRQQARPMIGGELKGGPYMRKAPCHFGWDWGPNLPPIGIWKDIALVGYSTAKFEDVHLTQKLSSGKGTLESAVTVENWSGQPVEVVMQVTTPDGKPVQETRSTLQGAAGKVAVEVNDPQIWWPNGYGSQPLYDVTVTLQSGGKVLDSRSYKIGFRTIELRRQPDQWGESFEFVVNGVPIFAKGSDWIPTDSFPARITRGWLEGLLCSAVAAHMNMLRVWGGGLYETEDFYDLCDQYGILIWQDFIFACGIYPEDAEFHANVKVEAIQNVRRLRHRTSLAMWCGNNEMEQGWVDWGWNKPEDANNQSLKEGYDRMFHHLLPDICAAEDPDRAYWPSSASSGVPFTNPNGQVRGDCHYWDVWHGRKPFKAYRSQYPRFMSEFGFQALPPFKTIQTYAEPADQNMTSYVMEHHQRSGSGNGLMIHQMTDTFRMPKDFEALVYLSMILQAEGIRYGVEHWRRNMDRVRGTLIWQLNDCWPVASWASLDYFGRWKALHYAARRFYAPVMLSVEDTGTQIAVHVTSDLVQLWQGEIRWRLEQLDGKVLDSGTAPVTAKALADTRVCTLDFAGRISDENCRKTIFVCELVQASERVSRCVALFAPYKHLELMEPALELACVLKDGALVIDVTAQTLAPFVELSIEGTDTVFSDNYFDLPAKSPAQVTCVLPGGWTLEQVKAALHARSLYNSFA